MKKEYKIRMVISKRRKYDKITHSKKIEFINRYQSMHNPQIKSLAEEMSINYSSAKKIISDYRRK